MIRAAVLALAFAAQASAQDVPADRAFLDRTVMLAVDDNCGLLDPAPRRALEAGQAQARNALIRTNIGFDALRPLEAEARAYGRGQACTSDFVLEQVSRVQSAAAAFLRTVTLTLGEGDAAWTASRRLTQPWRLIRTFKEGGYTIDIGLLAGSDPDVAPEFAVIVETGRSIPGPSSLRLHIRDTGARPEPWLESVVPGETALPPRALTVGYWPEDRTASTNPLTRRTLVRFRLPEAAEMALASLDPREKVELVIQPSARARSRAPVRVVFEVADFLPGRLFATLPPV